MYLKVRVPWLPFKWDAMALRWFIFHKGTMNDDLLRHEKIHLKQQRELGILKYLWLYCRNSEFRYAVEYEAYRWGSRMNKDEANMMAKRYR